MAKTEQQLKAEQQHRNMIRRFYARVKSTGEEVIITYAGTFFCWDDNGKRYDFYDLELLKDAK